MAVDISQARDDFYDNADYEADASLSKAKAFLTACIRLQLMFKQSENGMSRVEFGEVDLQSHIEHARAWIATQDTDRGRQHTLPTLSRFRDF